jgi:Chalcone isomerase-like
MKHFLTSVRALLAALCLAALPPVWAMHVSGTEVPEQIQVAGTPLVLNGAGPRRAYLIDFYVASLYLPKRSNEASAILGMHGAKRLQIEMLWSASSQDFNKAMIAGIRRNSTEAELQAIHTRMDRFEKIINAYSAVKKGDVLYIDFVPEKGTQVFVNGQSSGVSIEGEDFYNKVLEIFLGAHVNDEPLKNKLLGR